MTTTDAVAVVAIAVRGDGSVTHVVTPKQHVRAGRTAVAAARFPHATMTTTVVAAAVVTAAGSATLKATLRPPVKGGSAAAKYQKAGSLTRPSLCRKIFNAPARPKTCEVILVIIRGATEAHGRSLSPRPHLITYVRPKRRLWP
jgi:hypothetical protein